MSQQVKLLAYSQERLDLPDFNSLQDFTEEDFQLMQQGLVTGLNTYIIRGFTVSQTGPLTIQVAVANSVVIHGQHNGSLYYALSAEPALSGVATDGALTYWWLELDTVDGQNEVRTFWDPSLMSGAGAEFNQAVNTEQRLIVTLQSNNGGFPVGGNVIHLCTTLAAAGAITSFTDNRQLLFRLGEGGATPDLDNIYPWTSGRTEPGITGATPAIFTGGDKQLVNLKEAFDAITSVIKEMKWGTATGLGAVWYAPTPSTLSSLDICLTGGGIWGWNLGTTSLSFTADATILIPGTAFINAIQFAVSSPIVLVNAGDVAYVDVDRTASANLPVTVVASAAYTPAVDRFIIARRIANTAYVGIE